MEEELVGLVGGGRAVVPGDGDVDVGRDEASLEVGEVGLDLLDHVPGVGPLALGDRQGDRGEGIAGAGRHLDAAIGRGRTRHQLDVARGLGRSVHHVGDVGEIDRLGAGGPHHQGAHLFRRAQEGAGLDQHLLAVALEAPRRGRRVLGPDRLSDGRGIEPVARQALGVEAHPHGSRLAAEQGRLRDVGELVHLAPELGRDLAQAIGVVAVAPQGEREDRDVVDGAQLDQREPRPRRHLVETGGDLLVDLDQALLEIVPHQEAHGHQGAVRARSRVDVLDPRDLPHSLLEGHRHPVLHFLWGGAGHGHEEVDDGDDDLRLLLARRQADRQHPQGEGGQHHQRGQLRLDREAPEPAGRADATAHDRPPSTPPSAWAAGRSSTGTPSTRPAGGSTT